MGPLKKKFMFGKKEQISFRYVGIKVNQTGEEIEIDQDHYVEGLEIPELPEEPDHDLVSEEDQEEFCALIGRIGWIAGHSRPDLVFDHIFLSTKVGKASAGDMKQAIKVMKKLRGESTKMKFPK